MRYDSARTQLAFNTASDLDLTTDLTSSLSTADSFSHD